MQKTNAAYYNRSMNPNLLLPKKTGAGMALLVIDVQQGLFDRPTPIFHADRLLQVINDLAEQARQAHVPVFYIQHTNNSFLAENSPGWQLHPAICPAPGETVIKKSHGSAFEKTSLEALLDAQGVGRLIITGLVTHGCIKAAAQDAHRLGYEVTLVEDGHSNYHAKAAATIEEWNRTLAEIVEVKPAAQITFS